MEQSHTQVRGQARYMIPTHLNVEDKIITFNGFGVTMRQSFLLLVGWSTAFNVWRQLDGLSAHGMVGLILRIAIAMIPGLLSLILSLTTLAGRTLEAWLMVVLRYYTQPRLYLWRSLASRETFQSGREHAGNQSKNRGSKKHRAQVPFDLEDEQD